MARLGTNCFRIISYSPESPNFRKPEFVLWRVAWA
jgi:hypothetical protein